MDFFWRTKPRAGTATCIYIHLARISASLLPTCVVAQPMIQPTSLPTFRFMTTSYHWIPMSRPRLECRTWNCEIATADGGFACDW